MYALLISTDDGWKFLKHIFLLNINAFESLPLILFLWTLFLVDVELGIKGGDVKAWQKSAGEYISPVLKDFTFLIFFGPVTSGSALEYHTTWAIKDYNYAKLAY